MPEKGKPIFQHAPGSVVRARRGGEFIAFWQARSDLVKRGFRPTSVPLWRGSEPSHTERDFVSHECRDLQDAMLLWNRERRMHLPPLNDSLFDGSIVSLINCYVHDEDSPFRQLRWGSRNSYYQFLRVIERDHGNEKIADLDGRLMRRWHREWSPRGVAMSHGLMKHFRGLITFGKTILNDPECAKLSSILSDMKFKMGKPRTATLTVEQVNAIRARAHAVGWHSIAFAQTIQFVGMLRQRDVIGQWVPLGEPGSSDIIDGDRKWIWGIRWNEFDANMTLTHITSKKVKQVVIPYGEDPLFMEEMKYRASVPSSGPVIVKDGTELPWTDEDFRRTWRQLANDCGIPKNVQNRDARAGAITEAHEAGADLHDIRDAATHSDASTTAIYNRRPEAKTAKVLRIRVQKRNEQ